MSDENNGMILGMTEADVIGSQSFEASYSAGSGFPDYGTIMNDPPPEDLAYLSRQLLCGLTLGASIVAEVIADSVTTGEQPNNTNRPDMQRK